MSSVIPIRCTCSWIWGFMWAYRTSSQESRSRHRHHLNGRIRRVRELVSAVGAEVDAVVGVEFVSLAVQCDDELTAKYVVELFAAMGRDLAEITRRVRDEERLQ